MPSSRGRQLNCRDAKVPGERQSLVISLERLLGTPQEPKTEGGLRPTGHAGILPISKG